MYCLDIAYIFLSLNQIYSKTDTWIHFHFSIFPPSFASVIVWADVYLRLSACFRKDKDLLH